MRARKIVFFFTDKSSSEDKLALKNAKMPIFTTKSSFSLIWLTQQASSLARVDRLFRNLVRSWVINVGMRLGGSFLLNVILFQIRGSETHKSLFLLILGTFSSSASPQLYHLFLRFTLEMKR